jgi:hypothetical protein
MTVKNRLKWTLPLVCGAIVPILIWYVYFRDPMAGTTGAHMSEVQAAAQSIGTSTNEIIAVSELQDRVNKSRHLSPQDWRQLQTYLHSDNRFLKGDALHIAAIANEPMYRDAMIGVAEQALSDPKAPDDVQASALDLLWRKNAPDWQDEFRRLQAEVSATPRGHNMVLDELDRIQKYQRRQRQP